MTTTSLCREKHRKAFKVIQALALLTFSFSSDLYAAVDEDQVKRIYDRIAGVPPTKSEIDAMVATGTVSGAANYALSTTYFYDVTLKNMVTPWTNEEQTPFAPLNDYTATVIGTVLDNRDFRTILSTTDVYVGESGSHTIAPYSLSNNAHYEDLERIVDSGGSLRDLLTSRAQSLPSEAAAGVMTTRAAAKAFFSAGTNRAMLRFTLMNHLCMDLEQLKDTSRPADRIRPDVTRSPGGDSSIFLSNCVGCHSGMDPLAQAFAYYDYDYGGDDTNIDNGTLVYNTAGTRDSETVALFDESPTLSKILQRYSSSDQDRIFRVQEKYFFNAANFPYGYFITSDNWTNYWRVGANEGVEWGVGTGSGSGARTLGQELANTRAFAQCHVKRVFKTVCLSEPQTATDAQNINNATDAFMASPNPDLKDVFVAAAESCLAD